ncbi:hypothetical protein IWQ49_006365 [Labrenzia sp. EL_126]|nr:hypothetical protein [Labrenzia sp. EL_126]
MNVFSILDHADQQFGTLINGQRVTVRLRYNPTSDRWTFDLAIDDQPVLHGRRIVTGVDLLAAFDFDLGMIVALAVTVGAVPDKNALPAGTVKLFHATEEEIAA